MPKIQFIDHMKLKKKKDQIVNISLLLRRGNTIQEVKFGRDLGKRVEGRGKWGFQVWDKTGLMYRGTGI